MLSWMLLPVPVNRATITSGLRILLCALECSCPSGSSVDIRDAMNSVVYGETYGSHAEELYDEKDLGRPGAPGRLWRRACDDRFLADHQRAGCARQRRDRRQR